MRTSVTCIALAFVALAAGVAPASAKEACNGPAYVCGSQKASAHKAHKKAHKSAYKSHKKSARHASHKHKSKKRVYGASAGGAHGKASYYWQPQRVASGGWFNPNAMTAAHKTLPFGTRVRVTNKVNGRSVVVTINDRGPYIAGRSAGGADPAR